MTLPANRTDFKALCLRRLGDGAIDIGITDEQADDAIDLSLDYYRDYHYDGSTQTYYKHQITQDDIDNKYITLPENIFGAVRLFPLGNGISSSSSLFSVQYQIALNDLYTLTSVSMLPFVMGLQHLQLFQDTLIGQQPIRYNRRDNKCWLDMDWSSVLVGEYLLVEAYEVVDPDTYTDIWSDRWLIKYCIAQMKRQWGNNLKKYSGVALIGGVQFNGQQIYDEAEREVSQLEADALTHISLPVEFFVG